MKQIRGLLAIAAASGIGCGAASADILIAGATDQSWIQEVRSTILATGLIQGQNIDIFDLTTGTPNLAGYSAVLTFTDSSPFNSTAWGDALADFADAGGGVVQMTFSWNVGAEGRWFTGGYSPFQVDNQSQGTVLTLGTIHQPGHAVMNNVTNFNGGTSSYHNTGGVAAGATLIAEWSNNQPFAAEMHGFNGRIIGLNFFAPSSISREDFWVSSTDGGILMANALNYVIPAPGAAATLLFSGLLLGRSRRRK